MKGRRETENQRRFCRVSSSRQAWGGGSGGGVLLLLCGSAGTAAPTTLKLDTPHDLNSVSFIWFLLQLCLRLPASRGSNRKNSSVTGGNLERNQTTTVTGDTADPPAGSCPQISFSIPLSGPPSSSLCGQLSTNCCSATNLRPRSLEGETGKLIYMCWGAAGVGVSVFIHQLRRFKHTL